MSRQLSYLFGGAAFVLCASATAAAFAQTAPAPKTHTETQTIVRTEQDGVSHEVRVIREPDGKVTITRDGKTTVVDPHDAMVRAMEHMPHHRDMAEHLRAVLQLRPNQDAALQAYVQAMHPKPPAMTPADAPMAPRTTPERLALMQKHLEAHTAMMRAQLEATRRFYDQLDPGQKKAFDELHMSAEMGPMHLVSFRHMPMPPMPPMPPIPPAMLHTPTAPAPPSL